MRKILALLLSVGLMTSLAAGCSKKPAATKPSGTSAAATTAAPSQTAQAGSSDAASYPSKPINLVLGFAAGGSSDVMVRVLANTMQKHIGQPVVVVNKPGAGGWVAWEELAKSVKPDGYTFALINSPYITLGTYDKVNPRKLTIDDFDLLANQVTDYSVIAIKNNDKRYTDFPSLVEYAKKNKMISACSAVGIISDDATVTDRLNMELGTKFEIVQTAGAKESETMFLSGDSDVYVANIADAFTAHKNKDYKIIAVFAPKRSDIIPDVPTVEELGFGKMYGFSARGYALPKGVDPAIRAKLYDALKKSINDPDVMLKLVSLGAQTDFKEGKEYYNFLQENISIAKKIYGIK